MTNFYGIEILCLIWCLVDENLFWYIRKLVLWTQSCFVV